MLPLSGEKHSTTSLIEEDACQNIAYWRVDTHVITTAASQKNRLSRPDRGMYRLGTWSIFNLFFTFFLKKGLCTIDEISNITEGHL